MDSGILLGFIGIGLIGVANIATVAFVFGKIKQKVDDLCVRVERLEDVQNSKDRDTRRRVEVSG